MASTGSPSGNTTTTTNTQPWSAQVPYLTGIFNSAQNLWNAGGPQYYPGQTYAPPPSGETTALQSLGDTGQWMGTTGAQPSINYLNSQLSGQGLNANPAQGALSNLASTNQGQNNWGSPWLQGITQGNGALSTQFPYSQLLGLGGQNAGASGGAAQTLQSIASTGSPNAGQAMGNIPGVLNNANNQAQANLQNTSGLAYGSIAPTQGMINSAVGGPSGVLNRIATGTGAGTGARNELAGFAGSNAANLGNANSVLSNIAGGAIPGGGAANELGGFAGNNIATQGGSARTLQDFASGGMSGNPEQGALAQSILSSVLPGIQSQFIQGGGLSSPEAAYASTQGAAQALAPIEYQQWQQEQANQLSAANSLENAKLQGRGLQQSAAGVQGQLQQAGTGLQSAAAQAAGGLNLQGRGLQQSAAGQQGQLAQGATGLQSAAAQAQGNLGLQGAQAYQNAALNPANMIGQLGYNTANLGGTLGLGGAQTLGNLGLGQAGLQANTAGTLGSQILQGAGLQNQANTSAMQGALGEQGQQFNAANALGQQQLAGQANQINALQGMGGLYGQAAQQQLSALGLMPQTMQQPLNALSTSAQAGQQQQQNAQAQINDLVQRYNYGQTLPYNALNQLIGAVTGNYGGTTSLNQPFYQSTGANIGSGILGGLGAANMIGGTSGIFPGAISKGLAALGPFLAGL